MLLFALIYSFVLVVLFYAGALWLTSKAAKFNGVERDILSGRAEMLYLAGSLVIVLFWAVAASYSDKMSVYFAGTAAFCLVYAGDFCLEKDKNKLGLVLFFAGWAAVIVTFVLALIR